MNITRIETFFLFPGKAKNLLFTRVETDDGLYGWGESYVVAGKEKVVEAYIHALTPVLIGRSAFSIRHTAQALYDDFTIRRASLEFLAAWSGIEIALWDILGKKAGLPVYNLLGGAVREKVRVYANGWWAGAESIDETVRRAVAVRGLGYTALKWDPLPGAWRTFVDRRDEDFAVEHVKAMREALGPDVELLIDAHRRLSPNHSIRLARRLEEYGIAWYEEPTPPENIDLAAEVRRAVTVPIVLGESLYTREGFVPVLEKRAADILNPDIAAVGGISTMLDIAAQAQPYAVAISPHNYNSTLVGLAATVHLSAVITNFTIAELFVNLQEASDRVATQALTIRDGWVDLPTAPGLGVDIDIDELRRHPFQALPAKAVRQVWEEFPRPGYTPALKPAIR